MQQNINFIDRSVAVHGGMNKVLVNVGNDTCSVCLSIREMLEPNLSLNFG